MYRLIVLCVVLAVAVASPLNQSREAKLVSKEQINTTGAKPRIESGSFRSRVDHFRPQDNRTFELKYNSNQEYYNGSGPLFFFVNDAGVHTTEWIEHGLMVDLAREVGAALFRADHRYYGDNLPTP